MGTCTGVERFGDNPVQFSGNDLPVVLVLQQSEDQLAGTVQVYGVTIPVTGTVSQTSEVRLSGAAVVGNATASIADWQTTVAGARMTGSWRMRVLRGSSQTEIESSIQRLGLGGLPPPPPAAALSTIEQLSGAGTLIDGHIGQSIVVRGGPFNNIRFHWHQWETGGRPLAFGRLFILTQEYLGPPEALGPGVPGFVARSVRIENAEYVFDPDVTLQPGTKYWFLTDLRGQRGEIRTRVDVYPAGDYYNAATGVYAKAAPPGESLDANFTLRGRPVATP